MQGGLLINFISANINLMGTGGGNQNCAINLSTYNIGANAPACSIIIQDDGNYGCTLAIKQKTTGSISNTQFNTIGWDNSGNCTMYKNLNVSGATILKSLLGIGTSSPQAQIHVIGAAATNTMRIESLITGSN